MSLQDTVTKQYVSDPKVFADAFNYLIYNGEQVIRPEQLTDLDATHFAIPYREEEEGKPESTQKYRDVLKTLAVKTDDQRAYLVLGIENQSNVHYAMPVRNMLYDAMQYNQQVTEIAEKHKGKKGGKRQQKISTGEFLSGFYKNNKLIPVITLVLFFNPGEWDGPRSLFDMLDISNPIFKKYAQDYKIHIISPKEILESDLKKFSSSLREVIGCIKYSNDKNKLAAFIQDNPRMNIEVEAARVLEVITHTHIKREEVDDMGNVNMCKAIQEMIQDGRDEGRVQLLVTLIQSGDISLQRAAALMNMTPEEFQEKSKMIS